MTKHSSPVLAGTIVMVRYPEGAIGDSLPDDGVSWSLLDCILYPNKAAADQAVQKHVDGAFRLAVLAGEVEDEDVPWEVSGSTEPDADLAVYNANEEVLIVYRFQQIYRPVGKEKVV